VGSSMFVSFVLRHEGRRVEVILAREETRIRVSALRPGDHTTTKRRKKDLPRGPERRQKEIPRPPPDDLDLIPFRATELDKSSAEADWSPTYFRRRCSGNYGGSGIRGPPAETNRAEQNRLGHVGPQKCCATARAGLRLQLPPLRRFPRTFQERHSPSSSKRKRNSVGLRSLDLTGAGKEAHRDLRPALSTLTAILNMNETHLPVYARPDEGIQRTKITQPSGERGPSS